MPYQNKRHYRVVQKDQQEASNELYLNENCLTRLTVVGIIVYTTSIVLSMIVGYLIGKHE